MPLDVPEFASADRGISVLTVPDTRDEQRFPDTSAGVGGGGTSPEVTSIPAPSGAGGLSVEVRRGDVSPRENVEVGITISGFQHPGEQGDTYDQEDWDGSEAHGGNPDKIREISIPSGKDHAHESAHGTLDL